MTTSCPTCGGPMMRNANKTNPKHPDLICQDENCVNDKGYRSGRWTTPKSQRGGMTGSRRFANAPTASLGAPPARERPPIDREARFREVQKAYGLCVAFVLTRIVPELTKKEIPCDMSGVNAMSFSLFKATWGNPADYDFRQPKQLPEELQEMHDEEYGDKAPWE